MISLNLVRFKKIFILLLIVVILLACLIYVPTIGKKKVVINYAPSAAKLTITGRGSGSTAYLRPGIYTINLKMDNFTEVTKTINTNDNKQIYITMSPSNEDGVRQISDDKKIQSELQTIGGEKYFQNSQSISEKYSIIQYLPINGTGFTVGYGKVSDENKDTDPKIALYITAYSPEDRRSAIESIKTELAINPSDVEIIFESYENPFYESETKD